MLLNSAHLVCALLHSFICDPVLYAWEFVCFYAHMCFDASLVPSENKKDLRSIEETLQDIRTKKRARIAEQKLESAPSSVVPTLDSPSMDERLRLDESEETKVGVTET